MIWAVPSKLVMVTAPMIGDHFDKSVDVSIW